MKLHKPIHQGKKNGETKAKIEGERENVVNMQFLSDGIRSD